MSQTPSDASAGFVFIPDDPTKPLSTRDKEIIQSKVRSHAAASSHRKRIFRGRTAGTRGAPGPHQVAQLALTVPRSGVCPSCHIQQSCDCYVSGHLNANEDPQFTRSFPGTFDVQKWRNQSGAIKNEPYLPLEDVVSTSSPCPRPGFGCFRDEQFFGIPNGSDKGLRGIVDFQTQIMRPAQDVFTEVFDINNIYSFFVEGLKYPLFYHSGLALTDLVRERMDSKAAIRTTFDLLHHRGQALSLIRNHLKRPGWQMSDHNYGLISGIVLLACFEYISGKPNTARQHLRALDTVTDILHDVRNPAIKEPFPEQALVTFYKETFAMAGWLDYGDHTRPWQLTYPSFPIDTQLQPLLDKVPAGFYNLAMENKVSSRTVEILARAVDLEIDKDDETRRQARAIRSRQTRTYDGAFEACPVLHAADDTQAVLVDKMICFALIVFCSTKTHNVVSTMAMFNASKLELNSRLQSFQPETNAERECLVWLFIITINSCRATSLSGSVLTDAGMNLLRVFYTKFPELCHRKEWNDIERTLLRFFWSTELSRTWKRWWANLIDILEMPREDGAG